MPTRLKRPPFWRYLLVAGALIAFQVYLGFNVVSGQYGIESQKRMHAEIRELQAQSGALQARIDGYRHRVTLFDPQRLDPDMVTERARALLSMADPADIVIMVDPRTGKPVSSSGPSLAENKITDIISAIAAN